MNISIILIVATSVSKSLASMSSLLILNDGGVRSAESYGQKFVLTVYLKII